MAQSAAALKKEFEEVALEHMDALYNRALRMAKDATEAQDLAQDVYLRAYQFFDRFEQGTNFKAWLFKILQNVFINKYRREVREPGVVNILHCEEDIATATTPEDEIFDKLLDDDVARAIDALPDEFRLVVILVDLEGFSYKETAEITDRPMGTVMSRLHRGRKLLRDSLYEYAKEHGYVKN